MNIIFRDLLLLNLLESPVLEIVLPALIDMLDRLCRYLVCDPGCSSRALEQPGRKKGMRPIKTHMLFAYHARPNNALPGIDMICNT